MRILKGLGALIVAVILFFVVVVNFGTRDARLLCLGQLRGSVEGREDVTTSATLHARVKTYRWMIFWADHDVMIFWEIQPGSKTGFGYYDESSFGTPITDFEGTKTYGSFSSLSNRIYVETAPAGQERFEGQCK
jgi:hypothetical protein